MSQRRFGMKIGVTGKTISAYETGRCNPPLKILERISREYDVTFVHLKEDRKKQIEEKIALLRTSIEEIEQIMHSGLAL